MTENPGENITMAHGCLAPQRNWEDGWNMMGHLFHENPQDATEGFTEELKDALGTSNGDDNLVNLVSRSKKDWDFIEKNTHLYQVC